MEKWCFVKVAQLTLLSQSIRDFSHSAGQGLTKWLIYYCMSAGGLGTSHCIEWGYPFFPQSNRAYWCQAYLSSWSTPLLLDHFVFLPPSAFHFHQSTMRTLGKKKLTVPAGDGFTTGLRIVLPQGFIVTHSLLIDCAEAAWVGDIFFSVSRLCVCVCTGCEVLLCRGDVGSLYIV